MMLWLPEPVSLNCKAGALPTPLEEFALVIYRSATVLEDVFPDMAKPALFGFTLTCKSGVVNEPAICMFPEVLIAATGVNPTTPQVQPLTLELFIFILIL